MPESLRRGETEKLHGHTRSNVCPTAASGYGGTAANAYLVAQRNSITVSPTISVANRVTQRRARCQPVGENSSNDFCAPALEVVSPAHT